MTFLECINEVLARLREPSVTTIASSTYSTLIGKFVNDAKRQVEDAWDWNCLSATLTLTNTNAGGAFLKISRPREVAVVASDRVVSQGGETARAIGRGPRNVAVAGGVG
mgnify:CR=1 FL=1